MDDVRYPVVVDHEDQKCSLASEFLGISELSVGDDCELDGCHVELLERKA